MICCKGGLGNDHLEGSGGSDTYFYDSGHDVILEHTPLDTENNIIQFASGIKLSDIKVKTFNLGTEYSSHTYLSIAGKGSITISYANSWTVAPEIIKQLKFSDGTLVNLSDMSVDVMGTDRNDVFSSYGWTGQVKLYGLEGDDYIQGSAFAPYSMTFIGGVGNDYIEGGIGDGTYIYESGDDTYYEIGGQGNDKIVFANGITSSMVTIERVIESSGYGNDMMIKIMGLGSILLPDQYDGDGKIDILEFSNGIQISVGSMNDSADIYGTSGNNSLIGTDSSPMFLQDSLFGLEGSDTLNGRAGNDILHGGEGSDNYIVGQGFDYIYDDGYTLTDIDKITFSSSYDPTKFSYVVGKDQLYLDVLYNGLQTVRIEGQFWGSGLGVEQLVVTGKKTINLNTMSFEQFGTQENDTIFGITAGASPNDRLYGMAGDDSIYAWDGNDVIDGGIGDDYLAGGIGNDVYRFSSGFGRDVIDGDTAGIDTVSFLSTNITVDSIAVVNLNSLDTKIVSTLNTDEIIIMNQRSSDTSLRIENISFIDGFTANLSLYRNWIWGTTAAQTTSGTAASDTILGRGGNDTINGNDGNDALHGGSGNDIVKGGIGNDLVHGGIGADTLYGDAGNDILYGDDGLDKLYGGAGSDIFMFLKESAFKNIDVVYDFKKTENDKINIKDLLQGYDPLTKSITDFVQITTSGANSILKVDADGGANGFVQVATLNAITGLTDEQALVNSGHLVAL